MRLIDADALLAKWDTDDDFHNRIFDGGYFVKEIENAPTIEPRHGKWLVDDSDYWLLERSECHAMVDKENVFFEEGFLNYCPNCGSQNRGR